jgi:predicted DNA-binding transcriptional regulator AlpA
MKAAEAYNFPDPEQLTQDEVPLVLARVSAYQTALAARTMALLVSRNKPRPEAEEVVDAEVAAQLLGVSREWIYRNAKNQPFVRRFSRRVTRYERMGLLQWGAKRKT